MRVAFLVNFFPNLSETFILNQATGLLDRGCEVDIYAGRSAGMLAIHPDVENYRLHERTHYLLISHNYVSYILQEFGRPLVNFFKVGGSPRLSTILRYGQRVMPLRLLREAAACLDREPYDVVHCHFGPNGLRGMMLREMGLIRGKLVTSFYGYDVTRYVRQHGRHCYDRLFREGDLFIAPGEAMRRQLVELGCDESKLLVHHLGVSLDRFSGADRHPLPDDGSVRIVTVSRLVLKKGIEYGIRAVAELVKAGHRVTYTIVGDGPLRARLERLVQALGLGGVVKLVGWKRRPEVVDILSLSDVLLAPSVTGRNGDQEGTPVVLMEARAMGLPAVSTWHSGIPEIVEDGVSGYLVPERDVAALAEKLAYLAERPQVRTRMGQAGRKGVKERYNIDVLNDRLVETYRVLTDGQLAGTIA